MKRLRVSHRMLAALLALACLVPAGCVEPASPAATQTPAVATVEPAATPEPTATPQPAGEASRLLEALDKDAFAAYAAQDAPTLHALLADPSAFGLATPAEDASWGACSAEAAHARAADCVAFLERLLEIDRSALSERDQLSYDLLQQYFTAVIAADGYEYYDEPLSPVTGVQAWMPLSLWLYAIETPEDAEAYLALAADAPRYLAEVLAYERMRAEKGLFMTETALNAVLAEIDALLAAGDELYLIEEFAKTLDLAEGLTQEERVAFAARAAETLSGAFLDGFRTLRDGLSELSGACRREEGLYALGEDAQAYFVLRMQAAAASDMTPEDALLLLEQEYAYQYRAYYELNLSVSDADAPLKGDSVEEELAYLLEVTDGALPALPAHGYALRQAPKALGHALDAVVCIAPPLDAWERITVIDNPDADRNSLFLTLSREGYPGRLYLYAGSRNAGGLGLMQRALALPGYYDGWAAYAAELAVLWQDRYDPAAALMRLYDEMAPGVLMLAICSIKVNYEGMERDDLQEYLSMYGLGEDAHVNFFFNTAVDRPFAAFSEALGYAQLADMMRSFSADMGEAYLENEVLAQYLSYGPAYTNLLRERMDIWADEQVDKG